MNTKPLDVIWKSDLLTSDDRRVIPRFLDFGSSARVRGIIRRVRKIPRRQAEELLAGVRAAFRPGHRDIEAVFLDHYRRAACHLRTRREPSETQKLLIGSYFTSEYSIEGAEQIIVEIRQTLEDLGCCHGHKMKSTPPMFYREAILCAVQNARNEGRAEGLSAATE